LFKKITACAVPAKWAQVARSAMTSDLRTAYPLLTARIELAALFGLSRAEALLIDLHAADCGHCLLVDIHAQYHRGRRRLIPVQTLEERQVLDRVKRSFENSDCGSDGPEGNYRQRLYRFRTSLRMHKQRDLQTWFDPPIG
jgi:hypothetical protein